MPCESTNCKWLIISACYKGLAYTPHNCLRLSTSDLCSYIPDHLSKRPNWQAWKLCITAYITRDDKFSCSIVVVVNILIVPVYFRCVGTLYHRIIYNPCIFSMWLVCCPYTWLITWPFADIIIFNYISNSRASCLKVYWFCLFTIHGQHFSNIPTS